MSKLNPRILDAAMRLASKHGYQNITRDQIAKEAEVGAGTVNLHYSNMKKLRKTIISHALRTDNKKIIAQAIIANDPYIRRKLTDDERREALLTAV